MSKNTEVLKMNRFEEIINKKLKDYEAQEIPGAWSEFSAKIPKTKPGVKITRWLAGLGGIAIIAGITLVLIWPNSKTISTQVDKHVAVEAELATEPVGTVETENHPDASLQSDKNRVSVLESDNNAVVTNNTIQSNTTVNYTEKNQNTDNIKTDNTKNSQTKTDQIQHQVDQVDHHTNTDLSNIVINYNIIDICLPAKVTFEVKRMPAGYTYRWMTGNAQIDNISYIENLYTAPGTYYPTLQVFNDAGNIVKSFSLNKLVVYPLPVARFSFEKKNNLYIFSNLSEQTASLTWSVDNQVFAQSSLEYYFISDGEYPVKLIAMNEAGCMDEYVEKIRVNIDHNYFVPNAFRPYSDGVNASFGPIGDNLFEYSFKMLIFDKTGTMIFETNNIDNLWNGRINGNGAMAEPGVYSWEILTVDKNGTKKHNKGQLTLLKN